MGRPETDSSSYQTDQPQEYQHEATFEATQTQDDFSSQAYDTNYHDSTQQDQYQSQYADTSANNLQEQQQPQQQQPPPPPPQQQQQYPPPQANQGYGGQPAQPSQFPPQGPQTNPMYSNGPNRPPPYPPQGPQTNQTQPAPYPPQGPQTNPTQPAPYPPQGQQTFQTQPVQFPPPSPIKAAVYPPQGPQTFPNQPAQFPPQRPEINPMYQNGPNQPANFPQQGFQNSFQATQAEPQVVQFPPKTPVNGIPMQMNQQQEAWTTGIFDCMEDPINAVTTALFPCVTYGQVAEIVDNGQTTCATNGMIYGMVAFCIAMPCLVSCGYRSKLRAKYGLIEDPAPDWLTHFLFEWCALCQEYRELNNRGLDPSIGWQGNVARQSMQQAQVGMVPPMNQKMMP